MSGDIRAAERFYLQARTYVQDAGLHSELDWQGRCKFAEFSESDLLREHAWVTLCSGFRESIVRKIFDYVSLCFCDWESAEAIAAAGDVCVSTAASVFANQAKLRGILAVSQQLKAVDFESWKIDVSSEPIAQLQALPYIGPVTSWHLAKNLGLDVAKPDRHLVRLSLSLGFRDANHLCSELAVATGEQANVVDLVVWRYIADNPRCLVRVNAIGEN